MSAPFLPLPSFGCICHWASLPPSLLPPLRDKSLRRPSFLPFRSLSAISGKNAATLRRSTDANESVSHVARSPIRSPSPLIILARKFLPLHSPMKSGLPLSLVPPSNFLADFRPCPSIATYCAREHFHLLSCSHCQWPKLPLLAPRIVLHRDLVL